jgi:hypothetical protein
MLMQVSCTGCSSKCRISVKQYDTSKVREKQQRVKAVKGFMKTARKCGKCGCIS